MMADMTEQRIVVCTRITTPLLVPDNRIGKCSECGWKVQFRPDAPKARKLCLQCAADLISPDTKIEVPPNVIADLKNILKKRQS